mgnify:CR=1 FL=1|jgi:hypothetical protein
MPLYETIEDRLQADSVSDQLKAVWGLDVWSFSPYATTGDLLLGKDGMLRAICEVKTQNEARVCHDRFPHSVIVPIVVNSLAPGARRLPRVFELVILVSLLDAL